MRSNIREYFRPGKKVVDDVRRYAYIEIHGGPAMAYRKERKTIYIKTEFEPTWEEITEAARADRYGVGEYICMMWEKLKAKAAKK